MAEHVTVRVTPWHRVHMFSDQIAHSANILRLEYDGDVVWATGFPTARSWGVAAPLACAERTRRTREGHRTWFPLIVRELGACLGGTGNWAGRAVGFETREAFPNAIYQCVPMLYDAGASAIGGLGAAFCRRGTLRSVDSLTCE